MRAAAALLALLASAAVAAATLPEPLAGTRVYTLSAGDGAAAGAPRHEGLLSVMHGLPADPGAPVEDHVYLVGAEGVERLMDLSALPAADFPVLTMMRATARGEVDEATGRLRVRHLELQHTAMSADDMDVPLEGGGHRRVRAMAYTAKPKGDTKYEALFVMLNFGASTHSCGTTEAMVDLLWDGSRNVAGAFDTFSKGRAEFARGADLSHRVAGPYDTDFTTTNCDGMYREWWTWARDKAVEDGYDMDDYASLVVMTPRLSGCAWLGRASLYNCRAGIGFGSSNPFCLSVINKCDEFVISHELGHNLNLHHSASDEPDTQVITSNVYQQYADHSCLMGNQDSWNVLNSVKLIEKGWIHPDRVLELDTAVPFSGDIELAPTDIYGDQETSKYQIISFRDTASGVFPIKTYLFSMRNPVGYADSLKTTYREHVNVHTSSSSQRFSFYVKNLASAISTSNSGWSFEEVAFTAGVSATVRVTAPGGGGGDSPYAWSTGAYGACSASCDGTRTRAVTCRGASGDAAPSDAFCSGARPASEEQCNDPETTAGCATTYEWVAGAYGACSVTCGSGTRVRAVTCRASPGGDTVSTGLCDAGTRPGASEACAGPACPEPDTYSWVAGDYSDCPVTCGAGTQTRSVRCVADEGGQEADEELCAGSGQAPVSSRSCFAGDCPVPVYAWKVGECSDCSVTCGSGTRRCGAVCVGVDGLGERNGQTVGDALCAGLDEPDEVQSCSTGVSCGPGETFSYYSGAWSSCSVECGEGERVRRVLCLRDSDLVPQPVASCGALEAPRGSEPCVGAGGAECEADPHFWSVEPWSECSATCGGGTRTRGVRCRSSVTGAPAEDPAAACGDAPASEEACGDEVPCGGALCDAEARAACGEHGLCAGSADGTSAVCACVDGYGGDKCDEAPALSDVTLEHDFDVEEDLIVEWSVARGDPRQVTVLLQYRADEDADWDPLLVELARAAPVDPDPDNEGRSRVAVESYGLLHAYGSGEYRAVVRFSAAVFAESAPVAIEFADACALLSCANGMPCAGGECRCGSLYEGTLCETRVPQACDAVPCQHGSVCVGDGECDCNTTTAAGGPFSGDFCDRAPGCTMQCANGGAVDACARCECVARYAGDQCQECGLDSECARGKPDEGCAECVCEDRFAGPLCARPYHVVRIGPFPALVLNLDDEAQARLGAALVDELERLLTLDAGRVLFVGLVRDGDAAAAELHFVGLPPAAVDDGGDAGDADGGDGDDADGGDGGDADDGDAGEKAAASPGLARQTAADGDDADDEFAGSFEELEAVLARLEAALADEDGEAYNLAALGLLPAGEARAVAVPPGDGGDDGGDGSSSGSSGLSAGAAVGVAFAVVLVLGAVVALAVVVRKRQQAKDARRYGEGANFRVQQQPSSSNVTGGRPLPQPHQQQQVQPMQQQYLPRQEAAAVEGAGHGAGAVYGETGYGAAAQPGLPVPPPLPPRPLPEGWAEYQDDDNMTYYYNEVTGQSVWERPV